MAYQSSQDAINQPQSMDASSSIDVSAPGTSSNLAGVGEEEKERTGGPNSESLNSAKWMATELESKDGTDVNGVAKNDQVLEDRAPSTQPPQEPSQDNINSHETVDTHFVNGGYENEGAADESTYYHNSALDLAGGSDTDTSKADSVELGKDGNLSHIRSNSIKKPTSFKAVSVTKNYLAKTGAGAMAAAKASGDRTPSTVQAGSMMQQTAKPRLVAKFGRDSRASPVGNGPISGAPDASNVWNKNRPTPQPQQRQMTDEELKQHYGIHLATRIQADEAGKDSKWADIDDDEDNWAPETVEWIDGTKSTLLTAESQLSSQDKSAGSANKPDQVPDASRVTISGIQRPSSTSAGKTILRPGSHALGTQTKPGLVLRSVPENTTMQPKPPTPNVSKSPWAALPPVDKVPPVFINPAPPLQQQQPSIHREPQDIDPTIPVPSPAKEIAADDFDRSYGERQTDRGHRELFNSQSGRYEPVKDRRRSSLKNDGGFRPPAFLQRPPQAMGPAEPSPAFQTRRRTSSSLSDRNGIFTHSASVDKLEDAHGNHPPVFTRDQSPSTAHSGSQNQSPTLQQRYTVKAPDGKRPQPGGSDAAVEDPVAVQNRLMRERIELNRKRKQEEEAREEAARKERIRLKMESLGPAPSPAQEVKVVESSKVEPEGKVVNTSPSKSPPKPSSAAAISEAQSQILQKMVHSPAVDRAKFAAEPHPTAPTASTVVKPQLEPTTPSAAKAQSRLASIRPQDPKQIAPSKLQNDDDIPPQLQSDLDRMTDVTHDSAFDPKLNSWKPTPPNTDSTGSGGWANNPLTPHSSMSRNVWGPPTNDRSLGNGVFERDFHRLPSIQASAQHQMLQSASAPGPIGPPSPSPRIPYEASRIASSPSPAYDQPSPAVLPIGPQRYNSAAMINNRSHSQTDPSLMPRSTYPNNIENFHRPTNSISAAKSAWKNLPAQILSNEAAEQERGRREYAARLADEQRTGVIQEYITTFKETYRQTNSGEELGSRKIVPVAVDSSKQDIGFDTRDVNASTTLNHQHNQHQYTIQGSSYPGHGTQNGRPSRFFAPASDRLNLNDGHSRQSGPSIGDEDATPPPDGDDHPLFSNKSNHPLVNLPMIHETPKVKLPPPPTASLVPAAESAVSPLRSGNQRAGAQPIVTSASWQARFNGLFARGPSTGVHSSQSPESLKSPALPVASVSKAPLDASPYQTSATVALPQGDDPSKSLFGFLALQSDAADTKPADNVLFDEPEFGSSPTIKLARSIAADEHYRILTAPQNDTSRYSAPADPISYYPLDFMSLDSLKNTNTGFKILIQFPGKALTSVFMLKKAGTSTGAEVKGISRNYPKSRQRGQSLHSPTSTADSESRSMTLPKGFKRSSRPQNHQNSGELTKSTSRTHSLKEPSSYGSKDGPRAPNPHTPTIPTVAKDALKPRTPDQVNAQQPQKWAKPAQGKQPYMKKRV